MFSISCTGLDYLQFLKPIINAMCINSVSLIFHCYNLILEKEKKDEKKRERYDNLEAVYP